MSGFVRATCIGLLCFTLALSGCSSNNKGKIEGTSWSSQAATIKGNMIPAGTLGLKFGADGSLVYKVGPTNYTGKYSLGFQNMLTMHLDQALAGQKNHVETVVIEGDKLTMSDMDGTSLTFQKEAPGTAQ
jgi:hypothetical protein